MVNELILTYEWNDEFKSLQFIARNGEDILFSGDKYADYAVVTWDSDPDRDKRRHLAAMVNSVNYLQKNIPTKTGLGKIIISAKTGKHKIYHKDTPIQLPIEDTESVVALSHYNDFFQLCIATEHCNVFLEKPSEMWEPGLGRVGFSSHLNLSQALSFYMNTSIYGYVDSGINKNALEQILRDIYKFK